MSGQTGVHDPVLDVAGHFLGPDQNALDLRVVDGRIVGPGAEPDLVAGFGKELGRRLLETARGDAQRQNSFAHLDFPLP